MDAVAAEVGVLAVVTAVWEKSTGDVGRQRKLRLGFCRCVGRWWVVGGQSGKSNVDFNAKPPTPERHLPTTATSQ